MGMLLQIFEVRIFSRVEVIKVVKEYSIKMGGWNQGRSIFPIIIFWEKMLQSGMWCGVYASSGYRTKGGILVGPLKMTVYCDF